jgi:AraC-like DNA-binding protein
MYAEALQATFDFVTRQVRTLRSTPEHLPVLTARAGQQAGSARMAAYLALPEVLRGLGVDLADVLDAARLPASVFDDGENLVAYADLGRLLAASARLSNCDHIALLAAQRVRLTDMGLAGQIAACGTTVGEGLQRLIGFFALQNTAATVSLTTFGHYARFMYAIVQPEMIDTDQFQLGAMTVSFNILQDLCGPAWRPTVVTFACRAPANLRPCQRFFRSPLRFDSDESSIVFESHWLDRPLPQVDPRTRRRIEAEAHALRATIMTDVPAAVRHILRGQVMSENCSMDSVAAQLGMSRRTLDRALQQYGTSYREILESVQRDHACQLLRDTDVQVQRIAESMQFSSAANFATAFRRWTGVTPTKYRRRAGRQAG